MRKSTDIETIRFVMAEIESSRDRHIVPCPESLTEAYLEYVLAAQHGAPEDVMDCLVALIAMAWRMRTEYWIQVQDVMYLKTKALPKDY